VVAWATRPRSSVISSFSVASSWRRICMGYDIKRHAQVGGLITSSCRKTRHIALACLLTLATGMQPRYLSLLISMTSCSHACRSYD
jgi:hypothetical protein